ncbi:hypothetical protein RhiirB3_450456 [Rhizophagus irregularis]|nr:hypothetical protein RhiirB3_450456 [Rhizophagus irregularis]
MSLHRHACIIHYKQLTLYFISKENKIPDDSNRNTFKDFHATRLYNRWTKKKIHHNFSNRLGISFTTTYRAFNSSVVANKGLDFIYGKVYRDFSYTPSSSTKVRLRQEKRWNALTRHTFRNAKLGADAPMEDKLRAARHHALLFQEKQLFTKPIKHLRYKKKFVAPLQGYYTFPLPPSEAKRTSVAVPSVPLLNVNSVAPVTIDDPIPPVFIDPFENVPAHYIPLIPDSPIYDGGVLNQPSRNKIRKRKLIPLTVGCEAWLAHMEEIYKKHLENLQYDLDCKAAACQWDTTEEKGSYRKDLCAIIMEHTTAHHTYELKLREVSSDAQIVLAPLVRPSNHDICNREKFLRQKSKKAEEDKVVLEDLRNHVEHLDHAIYCGYHRPEVGLKFYPCVVMDDRILKRRALDNGNLDSHYSLHKDKKVCIIPTSRALIKNSIDNII